MKTDDLLNKVNEQILELMETHQGNWCKPWIEQVAAHGEALNVISKKPYSGINVFITALAGFNSNKWGTYKQWCEKGAQVKKGSKSTHIFFMSPFIPVSERQKENPRTAFVCKCYSVFNADQVDNFTDTDVYVPRPHPDYHDACEQFIAHTGANIQINKTGAFYAPTQDIIAVPAIEQYAGQQRYYSTLLHELTHWTGHESRLDRFSKERTRDSYAREELVAEIGATQLCALLGLENSPREDHIQYLQHWKAVIHDDNRAMMQAFSKAGKAVKLLEALQEREEAQTMAA